MKEEKRLEIISKINEKKQEQKLLNIMRRQVEELEKVQIIKKYLYLIDKINHLENNQQDFVSSNELINSMFSNNLEKNNCEHEIWFYEGSYYKVEDLWHENHYFFKTDSEEHANFSYNRYICAECQEQVDASDWEEFEKTHFVLKNQDCELNYDIEEYINLYYQLLYNNNSCDAKNLLIEKFNNKEKSIKSYIKK